MSSKKCFMDFFFHFYNISVLIRDLLNVLNKLHLGKCTDFMENMSGKIGGSELWFPCFLQVGIPPIQV